MRTSIASLITDAGLNPDNLKTAKWGVPLGSNSIGLYFISICQNPHSADTPYADAPIDEKILKSWITKVPTIEVDRIPATIESLKHRLNSFWMPDENIIYIGQTESRNGLRGRVNQYYYTELGERKPHAGGHWIKTLSILKELYVHYIPVQNPQDLESQILRIFMSKVSGQTIKRLYCPLLPIPFANLEVERGNRKNHGISKSKLL